MRCPLSRQGGSGGRIQLGLEVLHRLLNDWGCVLVRWMDGGGESVIPSVSDKALAFSPRGGGGIVGPGAA